MPFDAAREEPGFGREFLRVVLAEVQVPRGGGGGVVEREDVGRGF